MNEKDSVSIIVLAAGLSTRFGRNKLLEPVQNRRMIQRVVSECLISRAKQVIVVSGFEDEKIRRNLKDYDCEIVLNEDYEKGQSFSIKKGLSKVATDASAVMVLPGDIALANHIIINKVIDEYKASHAPIVAAAFKGHQGHPIIFERKLFQEITKINEETQGLRSVVLRHKEEVRLVETSEAAIIDIDRELDLQRISKHLLD